MQYAMTQPEIAYIVNGVAMKATIDVQDRHEADRMKAALRDTETRAFITIIGALADVPAKARQRILTHVTEYYQDQPTTP